MFTSNNALLNCVGGNTSKKLLELIDQSILNMKIGKLAATGTIIIIKLTI